MERWLRERCPRQRHGLKCLSKEGLTSGLGLTFSLKSFLKRPKVCWNSEPQCTWIWWRTEVLVTVGVIYLFFKHWSGFSISEYSSTPIRTTDQLVSLGTFNGKKITDKKRRNGRKCSFQLVENSFLTVLKSKMP